jgi:hypothetical protein
MRAAIRVSGSLSLEVAGRAGHPPARRGPFLPSSSGIKARAELSAPKNLHAKSLFDFFLTSHVQLRCARRHKKSDGGIRSRYRSADLCDNSQTRFVRSKRTAAKLKCNFTDSRSRPLWTRAKIQSSTDPLSECVCFCRLRAPRALKLLIRNFTGEKFFLVLIGGQFIHGICPSVYGQGHSTVVI